MNDLLYIFSYFLNLNYLSNPTDISKLVRADGIILGRVAIYEIIRVDKVVEELKYSSNIKEKYELKIFNKNVIKEGPLDYSYTVYNDIFTINNIIAFNKVVHFKQEKVITVYNYESAKSYAYSKIIYNFNLVKCHKNEKIFYIDFIDYKETDSYYEFRFLTSYNRNIGTFIKYD